MKKAQIFTIDLLFSIFLLTLILSIVLLIYETPINYSSDIINKKNYLFALSLSDLLVKRYLVLRDYNGLNVPNKIDVNSNNFSKTWNNVCNLTKEILNSPYMKFTLSNKGIEVNLLKYDQNTGEYVTYRACDYYLDISSNGVFLKQGKICNPNFPNYVEITRPLINDDYIQAPLEGSGNYVTSDDIFLLEVIIC